MAALFRLATFFVEIFPTLVKAYAAWEQYNQGKVTKKQREAFKAAFESRVNEVIQSKDTSALETLFGRPPPAEDTPEPEPEKEVYLPRME